MESLIHEKKDDSQNILVQSISFHHIILLKSAKLAGLQFKYLIITL